MNDFIKYKEKRIRPPIWQHDYFVLTRLKSEVIKACRHLGKQYKVLDYGCGQSPYQEIITSSGAKLIKIDIGLNPLADISVEENCEIPLKNNSLDMIISTQVLEHVADPDFYLKECHRLLKKKGRLVLSTHGIWPYHPFPADYWRFTAAGLQKIVASYNLKVIRFVSLLGTPASIVQFVILGPAGALQEKGLIARIFLAGFSLFTNALIYLLDKFFPYKKNDDGSLYFLIAVK